MKLKTLIIVGSILCSAVQTVDAATVDIAASGSESWNKTVVGTYIKNTKIKFSEAGKYTISLQDTNFGANFEMLGAMISSPSTKYVDMVLAPESMSNSRQFTVDKAGDYFLNVFAITDSILFSMTLLVTPESTETTCFVATPSCAVFIEVPLVMKNLLSFN